MPRILQQTKGCGGSGNSQGFGPPDGVPSATMFPTTKTHTIPGQEIPGETNEEETEGLFTYRTADRRGDHPDHRGDCYPELAALAHGGQRSFGRRLDPHHEHGSDFLQLDLRQRLPPVD